MLDLEELGMVSIGRVVMAVRLAKGDALALRFKNVGSVAKVPRIGI